MGLEAGARGVVTLHVIHHHPHDPGNADEKAGGLQRVRYRDDRLERAQLFVGCLVGFHMATRFCLDLRPASIDTFARATPYSAARNSMSAAFARPSTARAASRIFSRSPCIPAISVRHAPGCTCSSSTRLPPLDLTATPPPSSARSPGVSAALGA